MEYLAKEGREGEDHGQAIAGGQNILSIHEINV
jgi:hypothetical protein